MKDIFKVVGTARLAADPELRQTGGGTSVCQLRLAWSTSRKVEGEWVDQPNFIDMAVFGNQGEACNRFLEKGRQVVFEARLEQRSWDDKETGKKRYAHQLVAEQVQFVGGGGGKDNGSQRSSRDEGDFQPADGPPAASSGPPGADDDIPFLWDGPPDWDVLRGHVSRW